MRIQVIILPLLGAILGVTGKVLSSNKAKVKNEELDLLADSDILDRQIREDEGLKKGKKKPKPKPKPKPKGKCVIPEEGDSKNMPNVNYFLRGYNIMKGNPHQVSVSTVDPGFQEPIFSLCYDNKRKTPDGLYLQPDGTLITMCQSCSLSAVTKIISGMDAYQESLSEKVKATDVYSWLWPWWDHRFSWSSDYQNVQNGIYQHSNYYTHSHASCCAYQIQTDTYTQPPFSKDFLDGVDTLPESYESEEDKTEYKRFIEAFGTHYVKQADMGSLFGQQTKMSQETWMHMNYSIYSSEQVSSWSAMLASGSYNITASQEMFFVSEFNKWSTSQHLYTKGSKPPKDNSMESWVTETKKYPAPISLELGSILDLFKNLDDLPDAKYENMEKALTNYCGSNCETIQNNPWLTNMTMGQRSEPKSCDKGEYVTGVQFSRAGINIGFWPDGLYDLCFNCSNSDVTQCFNAPYPPPLGYDGYDMICPNHGFQKMTTYTPEFYEPDPINVKAQCNDDTEPQYAFPNWSENWAPWVSCQHKKIVGFQVLRFGYGNEKIANFRINCA